MHNTTRASLTSLKTDVSTSQFCIGAGGGVGGGGGTTAAAAAAAAGATAGAGGAGGAETLSRPNDEHTNA